MIGGRLSYSYVDAERTDPSTGIQARAPFDITNSVTLVADKTLPRGLSVSGALRYATGKPYSPVNGATFNQAERRWIPSYGSPYSLRLPPFQRVDLSISRFRQLSPQSYYVLFASINNVFNRVNVYEYRYSEDFTKRIPIRSLFNRSLYVGGSISFGRQ